MVAAPPAAGGSTAGPGKILPASPAAMASMAMASAGDSSISWIVTLRSTPRARYPTILPYRTRR